MKYSKDMFKNRPRAEIKDPRAPFHRCFRPVISGLSERDYLNDDDYAQRPYSFTKAFLTLQKEIVCLVGLLSVVIRYSAFTRWADNYGFFKSHRTNGLHAK